METDSSDYGIGAVLSQLGPNDEKFIIAYYSKALDNSMLRRPIFYKEAWALIWGLDKSRMYSLSSNHPIIVKSDHRPLLWIKHCRKGPITAWLMDSVSDVDFKVEYIKGIHNGSDFLTRMPFIKSNVLSSYGIELVWKKLLEIS